MAKTTSSANVPAPVTGSSAPAIPTIVAPLTTNEPVETPAEVSESESSANQEPVQDADFWKKKASTMERESQKAQTRLAILEKKEQERQDSEKSELQKAQERAEAAEKRAAEAERRSIRQKVAAETGLPLILAERLQGDDEDAMRADAAKLLEALPKSTEPKKPNGPVINPTNPAAASLTETLAQKKERLHLTPGLDPFGDSFVQASGGGIFLTEK
jgi:hypothetical protein